MGWRKHQPMFSELGSYSENVLGLVDEFDDENEEKWSNIAITSKAVFTFS